MHLDLKYNLMSEYYYRCKSDIILILYELHAFAAKSYYTYCYYFFPDAAGVWNNNNNNTNDNLDHIIILIVDYIIVCACY